MRFSLFLIYIFHLFYQTTPIRILQYNVEWLFYNVYNNCPGSSCTWHNQTEALIHMNYVADTIRTISPNFVNFCEVEGIDELSMLNSMLGSKYTPALIKGTDSSTGQNVGILSDLGKPILQRTETKWQYPLPDSNCGYDGTIGHTGVSKHYYTYMNIYDIDVLIIGVHLLAFPDDKTRCVEREAQAQIIQELIYNHSASHEILVMGDMNDFDEMVPDLNGNMPISHALDIIKGLKGEYMGKYELLNIAGMMSREERWTDWWDKNGNCISSPDEFSMIDHILMSDGLAKMVKNVSVYHGYEEFCGKMNSDHYPVIVDL